MTNETMKQYAKLTVRMGINLQKGQDVIIYCSTYNHEFGAMLMEECYLEGARRVTIEWSNDITDRLNLQYISQEALLDIPDWQIEKTKYVCNTLPCRIYVEDSDPDKFAGLDMDKFIQYRIKHYGLVKKYLDEADCKDQWVIVALPSPAWAKAVFPELSEEEALVKLENAILHTMRLDQADPFKAWEDHIAYLAEKAEKMNAHHFTSLRYKSANGTDFTVGLHPKHVWLSARERSLQNIDFCANMPTEEVFTMPAKYTAQGTVVSTKPLSYNGKLIEDFKVTFENGKAVAVEARKNQDVLDDMLNMDESSRYLGEVALVPFDSPINELKFLFLNTLFDENACCHLAFGEAFKNNLEGYENYTEEDLKAMDVNESVNHVDFMIGSEDLSIIGIKSTGEEVIVFENGKWAL
ncbi:MAG: aminopeptidase [Erysipelotrichales bacterium]|nr:aminopeptidase [Erysipelotrichales bacterium]